MCWTHVPKGLTTRKHQQILLRNVQCVYSNVETCFSRYGDKKTYMKCGTCIKLKDAVLNVSKEN